MPDATSPRILLVEDDARLRATLLDWLVCSGYDTVPASDGLEAIALARQARFDVIITDLKLPRMDGLQLLTALQDVEPAAKVIFFSGEATVDDVIEALREGRSFDFLRKPLLDLQVLNQVIERALGPRAEPAPVAQVEQPPNHPILATTLAYIEAHYREGIGLSEVAAAVGYSAPYLTDFLRRETGRSAQRWIIAYRLLEAKRLLVETDWNVQRIAEAIGYAHVNHFVRQFRQHNGAPPATWRGKFRERTAVTDGAE